MIKSDHINGKQVANSLLINKHTTYLCPDVRLFTGVFNPFIPVHRFHRNETARVSGSRQSHWETSLQERQRGGGKFGRLWEENVVSFSLQLWKTLVRFSRIHRNKIHFLQKMKVSAQALARSPQQTELQWKTRDFGWSGLFIDQDPLLCLWSRWTNRKTRNSWKGENYTSVVLWLPASCEAFPFWLALSHRGVN